MKKVREERTGEERNKNKRRWKWEMGNGCQKKDKLIKKE
jgi:hypothetical protein